MAVMGGCGTNRAGHGTGHGTIDLSAVAAQKAPTPVKSGTKLASVHGKIGGADPLPVALAGAVQVDGVTPVAGHGGVQT